jgi:hypothetical protein
MTADMLTAGLHLRGTVYREVDGVLIEEIPVVHRARTRSRLQRPYRIDVTYESGHHGRYDPHTELAVLEAS